MARTKSRTRTLFRSAITAVLLAGVSLSVVACGADNPSDAAPAVKDVNETGRELATKFLTLLQNADTEGLDEFLDPAFQIQRADGSSANKAEYLQNPAKVKSFELGEGLSAALYGNVLTVRYSIVVNEEINGKQFTRGEAPRLSTFSWHSGKWHLVSHGNFNVPEGLTAPVADDPVGIGKELVAQFITILKNKDRAALGEFLAPAFQIQRADGTGANRDEYLATEINISSFEIGQTVTAVQEGGILTVRWSLLIDETINGSSTSKVEAPRLSTFIWEGGSWKLLSHANFNPPVS